MPMRPLLLIGVSLAEFNSLRWVGRFSCLIPLSTAAVPCPLTLVGLPAACRPIFGIVRFEDMFQRGSTATNILSR